MKSLMFVSNPLTNDPRVFNEALSLTKGGHQVTVVAFDRQGLNASRDKMKGIEVIHLKPRYFLYRMPGSLIFTVMRLIQWHLLAYRRALELWAKSGFDVIHCHDLDTLIIGIQLKRKFHVPLIYDAHEIYGYMIARSIPYRISRLFLRLERFLLRNVDHIITVVEPLANYFNGVSDRPVSIVMNCKPLQSLEYEPPKTTSNLTILYIGALHQGRGVKMLIEAVSELTNVHCIIGGIGSNQYVRSIEKMCEKALNAKFIGKVPMDRVISMTKEADVVFLMVNPHDYNNRLGLGNKQFEAMVCGRPIICTKGTHSGEITEQEEVGLTVEYNQLALQGAITILKGNPELREALGRNALKSAITKYNWERQEKTLLEIYNGLKSTVTSGLK